MTTAELRELNEQIEEYAPALKPLVPPSYVAYDAEEPSISVRAIPVDPKRFTRMTDPNSLNFDSIIDLGEVSLPPQLRNANPGTIQKFVSIRELLLEKIRNHARSVTLAQVDEAAEALGIFKLFDLKLFLDARRSVR